MHAIDKVIELLEDDKEIWIRDRWKLMHARSDITIWRCNIPVLNTNTWKPYPMIGDFNLWQKYRLYRACLVAEKIAMDRYFGKVRNVKS